MIIPYNNTLSLEVNRYLDVLNKTSLHSIKEYSIAESENLTKEKYGKNKEEIEGLIIKLLKGISQMEGFSIALFVFRSYAKRKMHNEELSAESTMQFKVINRIFLTTIKNCEEEKSGGYILFDDTKTIEKILCLDFTAIENEQYFDARYFMGQQDELNDYFEDMKKVSVMKGDMHSYQIKNEQIKKYLCQNNLTEEKIKEYIIKKYKGKYIRLNGLEKNSSWIKMQSTENINKSEFYKNRYAEDVVITRKDLFSKYNNEFLAFVENFEAKKCQNPTDIEAELIFLYDTGKYVFISKGIMCDALEILNTFISWGQYGNLSKYFWNIPVDQQILRKRNRIMTYKIADILLEYRYILPIEKVNGNIIPRIEIANYTSDKMKAKALGDIDLIFYSSYTKTLYLVEYKNYQMMVSSGTALNAEVSKVKREDSPQKVVNREKYVKNNLEKCVKNLFGNELDIKTIKSIILTTKPCFYFYLHKSDQYMYMEWIEFQEMISKKKL